MRVALCWLIALAACGDPTPKPPASKPATPARDVVETAPPADAPPQTQPPDAGPDEALADPMKFVETRAGKLPEGMACPDQRPCVVEYDFAFYVLKRGWREHYVIDLGNQQKPIRQGDPSTARIDRRAAAAVAAVLRARREKRAAIHCGLAGPMRDLLGYDASGYVPVEVPARTKAAPATPAPPAPLSPQQVNAQIERAYAELPATTGRDELFTSPVMSTMTADSFERPRISRLGQWMSQIVARKETFIAKHFVAVWSPDSRKVYFLDRSWSFPGQPTEAEHARRRTETEAEVIELLQSLGLERADLDTKALCEYPVLTGAGEFLEAKLSP
jgi:hypothetical protein